MDYFIQQGGIMMLPTATNFIAHCPLLTISLPTGLDQKQQKQKHCSNNSSGQLPTGFAHLPTVQTLEPATVSCSGQWARFPLLLRSNADAFPTRGKAISTLATNQQF
jgi:hypothetical protein